MKSVKELNTKEEMKEKLYTYHKLIDWIDEYYYEDTKEGSHERNYIDNNWKELCRMLGEYFEEAVQSSCNPKEYE